ncbi:MAG: LacI family DNA-binding transcriptional regulator [Opitutae bacterium]|nr:LacI family DNA-binding transcriptional regulator [Opitutae bacterium]
MPKKEKVSQKSIARDLGVSQPLVSLALNGRKDELSPETYKRIWDRALELGYCPKGMRVDPALTAAGAKNIGFILRSGVRLYQQNNFFGHVQHGLHDALAARGGALQFLGSEDLLTPEKLRRIFAPGHALQGVVLLGEVARPFLDQLRALCARLVAVSARYPGLCHSVQGNDAQSLEQVVRHLHELGHRRIGWLGGNVGLERHTARLAALQNTLEALGLSLDERYVVKLSDGDRAEGAEAVHALLPSRRRQDFPTAFVCYNSTMAAGAMKAFQREGWRVPADVSVAGADISRINLEETPHITGAGTNPEKIGEVAAKLLLGNAAAEEGFTDMVLTSQLVVGDTTGPAAK